MRVAVDEIWSTPSTVHIRVLVWGPDNAWRHKYWCAVPIGDIPEEVLVSMSQHLLDVGAEEDHAQTALF